MYNIFQKQIYIKHHNIIDASYGKLTSYFKLEESRIPNYLYGGESKNPIFKLVELGILLNLIQNCRAKDFIRSFDL